jgi:hypothetical protein
VLPADVACRECRCAASFDRSFHRRVWCGGLLLALFAAEYGSGSAGRDGLLAKVIGATRSGVGLFMDSFGLLGLIEYNGKFHD